MQDFKPLSDSRIKELEKAGYWVTQTVDLDAAPWIWMVRYGASQDKCGREPKTSATAAEAWFHADRYARSAFD